MAVLCVELGIYSMNGPQKIGTIMNNNNVILRFQNLRRTVASDIQTRSASKKHFFAVRIYRDTVAKELCLKNDVEKLDMFGDTPLIFTVISMISMISM